jgi:hypothetical protein
LPDGEIGGIVISEFLQHIDIIAVYSLGCKFGKRGMAEYWNMAGGSEAN